MGYQVAPARWRTLFNGALPAAASQDVPIPSPRKWSAIFVGIRGASFAGGTAEPLIRLSTDGAAFDAVAANYITTQNATVGARTGIARAAAAAAVIADVQDFLVNITTMGGDFPMWNYHYRNVTTPLQWEGGGWWANSGGLPIRALRVIGDAGAGNFDAGTLLVKVFG